MKARLRRGFKTEANAYAREYRSELGLQHSDPLCPWTLAEHLAIPVVPMSTFAADIPDAVHYLSQIDRNCFSAATVFHGYRRMVVHNDANHPHRQASDLAHELAHGILGHPPMPPLGEGGCRNFNPGLEAEANWLGPALLVSEEAALEIAHRGLSIEEASRLFAVSRPVIQMRLNVTNARVRVRRSKRIYA